MDVIRYLVSTTGVILYGIINGALGVLPAKSRQSARMNLDALEGTVSLLFGRSLMQLNVPRVDLTDKVAIVTGANSGIGQYIATELACSGAQVYLACRSESKAQVARDEIISRDATTKGRVHILKLDVGDLDSVRAAADTFKKDNRKLDILIHNAGVATLAQNVQFSPQGLEITYASNLLGSFLLTYLLEDRLATNARVIFTTSNAQYASAFSKDFPTNKVTGKREVGFHTAKGAKDADHNPSASYANNKAMQTIFARLLQQRFSEQQGSRRVAHCFEPGYTKSAMPSKMENIDKDIVFRIITATENILATETSQGAATGLWLATTDDPTVVRPGKEAGYWSRTNRRSCVADLMDETTLRRFWMRWENDAGIEWR